MAIEITSVPSGIYTHRYAKHPRYLFAEGLYLGLTVRPYRYDATGNYVPSTTHTLIEFTHPHYSADQTSFLPGPIIVENDKVDAFIQRAAEWYTNEYDLYLAGRDAAWEESDTLSDIPDEE